MSYKNERGTYLIIDTRTGEVVERFRLRLAAETYLKSKEIDKLDRKHLKIALKSSHNLKKDETFKYFNALIIS